MSRSSSPSPASGGCKSRRSDACRPLADDEKPTNDPPPTRIESPGSVAQSTTSLIDRRQLLLPYDHLLLANCSALTSLGVAVPDRTGPGQSSSVGLLLC